MGVSVLCAWRVDGGGGVAVSGVLFIYGIWVSSAGQGPAKSRRVRFVGAGTGRVILIEHVIE